MMDLLLSVATSGREVVKGRAVGESSMKTIKVLYGCFRNYMLKRLQREPQRTRRSKPSG